MNNINNTQSSICGNQVLRAQLGGRRLRFTDDQRRSLAAKDRLPGTKTLAEMATIVTSQTLHGVARAAADEAADFIRGDFAGGRWVLRATFALQVENVRQAIARYFPPGTRISRPDARQRNLVLSSIQYGLTIHQQRSE
jgi:hypothetical protein